MCVDCRKKYSDLYAEQYAKLGLKKPKLTRTQWEKCKCVEDYFRTDFAIEAIKSKELAKERKAMAIQNLQKALEAQQIELHQESPKPQGQWIIRLKQQMVEEAQQASLVIDIPVAKKETWWARVKKKLSSIVS